MISGEAYIVAAAVFAVTAICLWLKTTRKVNEIKRKIEQEWKQ